MAAPASPASSSKTASPVSSPSSSRSSSPQVFFGRKRSQHELRTLAKLQTEPGSLQWECLPTPVRRVTRRDSREFHRRKTLLVLHPDESQVKQWQGGLQEKEVFLEQRAEVDTLLSGSDTETESEAEVSSQPYSFTFSLNARRRASPSLSPASSVASSSSSPLPADWPEQERGQDAHCDLTLDFDNFVFEHSPRKSLAVNKELDCHEQISRGEAVGTVEADGWSDPALQNARFPCATHLGSLAEVTEESADVAVEEENMLDAGTVAECEEERNEMHEGEPVLHEQVDAMTLGEALELGFSTGHAVQDSVLEDDNVLFGTEVERSLLEDEQTTPGVTDGASPVSAVRKEKTISPKVSAALPTQRQSPPSAAELASMVADDNVGLAELAAAVAAISMGREGSQPPPESPSSDCDSPLPTFRAGPVIIPAILNNRHPIRDCGPSPYRELPSPSLQAASTFSPELEARPTVQMAVMDSPTPASDLLASPTVQAVASRATPQQRMMAAEQGTPLASQSQPPALVYPPRSKILKSAITSVVGTPMQRPREKKADPREQAIRGQLNAAISGTSQRTLGSSVAPMSAARPTPQAARVKSHAPLATPLSTRTQELKTLGTSIHATPRSMAPPVPSSIPRTTLQAPLSASRTVLAPRPIPQASVPSLQRSAATLPKPSRTFSQLPKPSSKLPQAEPVAIKKPMAAPVAVPVRAMVGVSGRPALALGAPSRLVGTRQVHGGSGRVMPSPARRGLGPNKEPVYSTYKPSSAFVFTASTIAEPVHEACAPTTRQASPVELVNQAGPSFSTNRTRASSDDASSLIPECPSSSPTRPPPIYEEGFASSSSVVPASLKEEKVPKTAIKQLRAPRPARVAAQATNEALAPPAKPRRKPAVPVPSAVPNMSEKELSTKTKLNTNRNQVYFCAINRIIVRKEGERPPSPTSKIRTVAEREEAEKKGGRLERAKRRRQSSEGLTTDEEDEQPEVLPSRMTHMRGPGDDEDFVTPARPAKRMKPSPDMEIVSSSSFSSMDAADDKRVSNKAVTWDKGLVVIRGRSGSSASGLGTNEKLKSCMSSHGKPQLDQHGNLISTGRPLADFLKRTRIDVTAIFYDGEEPVPVKAPASTKKKGKK